MKLFNHIDEVNLSEDQKETLITARPAPKRQMTLIQKNGIILAASMTAIALFFGGVYLTMFAGGAGGGEPTVLDPAAQGDSNSAQRALGSYPDDVDDNFDPPSSRVAYPVPPIGQIDNSEISPDYPIINEPYTMSCNYCGSDTTHTNLCLCPERFECGCWFYCFCGWTAEDWEAVAEYTKCCSMPVCLDICECDPADLNDCCGLHPRFGGMWCTCNLPRFCSNCSDKAEDCKCDNPQHDMFEAWADPVPPVPLPDVLPEGVESTTPGRDRSIFGSIIPGRNPVEGTVSANAYGVETD
ncbi:MAG: hypothetical protein FWD35_05785 [Oscillospiraceae bacterium]|nr:hypothetical protein [Oscillospiraceae bacterium]